MFHQPDKFSNNEAFIKQEGNFNPVSPYQFSSVGIFDQVVEPYPPSTSVPIMAHQYSSQSYCSSSTQDSYQDSVFDSSFYYGPITDNWAGFEAPERCAASPVQDSCLPPSTPTNDQHTYLNEDMQQTPIYPQNPAQMTRQSSNASGKGEKWQCLACQSHFTRSADLSRHYKTVHHPDPEKFDCPKRRCGRVGDNGFTRKDHLKEHLRQYHKDPKVGKRGSK